MMVRFVGVGNFSQRIAQGAGSLRIGAVYPVLEVFAQSDGANKFRIHFSDVEIPSLFDSRMFEIISDRIPSGWRAMVNWGGSLVFGPNEWHREGFWEAFMDHEDWAVQLYKIGYAKSVDEASG